MHATLALAGALMAFSGAHAHGGHHHGHEGHHGPPAPPGAAADQGPTPPGAPSALYGPPDAGGPPGLPPGVGPSSRALNPPPSNGPDGPPGAPPPGFGPPGSPEGVACSAFFLTDQLKGVCSSTPDAAQRDKKLRETICSDSYMGATQPDYCKSPGPGGVLNLEGFPQTVCGNPKLKESERSQCEQGLRAGIISFSTDEGGPPSGRMSVPDGPAGPGGPPGAGPEGPKGPGPVTAPPRRPAPPVSVQTINAAGPSARVHGLGVVTGLVAIGCIAIGAFVV